MNKEIWTKIESIYDQVIEMDIKERVRFIKDHADGDDVYQQVIKMLKSDTQFMEEYPGLVSNTDNLTNHEPTSLGHFKVIKKVATGGMGRVYLAQSMHSDVTIHVALKTIRVELTNKDLEQKFQNEKQILSRLKHKNIASLIDAGVSEDKIPYIATEWVEGKSINDYCADNELSLNNRLNLFKQICSAVSFAHNKLIIHRDLKPDNILVDSNAQVKLLDFGIAKIVDESNNKQTQTQIYTPDYASPEQINGELCTVGTDVYSLGVVLFEILTDSKRFDLSGLIVSEKIKAICEPKVLDIKTIGSKSNIDNALLNIINKAMHVDQSRRYQSVSLLSADIDNYINNRPVSAMKDSLLYKTKMFLLRNRMASFLSTLVFLAVITGLYINNQQVKLKLQEANKSQVMLEFFQDILKSASPSQGGSTNITVKEMFDSGIAEYDFIKISDPYVQAELSSQIGQIYGQLGNQEKHKEFLSNAIKYYGENLTTSHNIDAYLRYTTDIGASYTDNLEYAEASDYITASLAKIKDYDLNPVHLAETYLELATIYKELNEFKDIKDKPKAKEYLDKAESLVEGSDNYMVLGEIEFFKHNFGSVSVEQAMQYIKNAELLFEKGQQGKYNPNIESARSVRANFLMRIGNYQAAAELHDVVRKQTIETYGNDNFIGLITQADNLNILGKFHKSRELLAESLTVHKQYNLPKDPPYYGSLLYTAQVMVEFQEFEKAEALFQESFDFFTKILPEDHSYLKISNGIRSELYLKSADDIKLQQAKKLLEGYLNADIKENKLPMYFKYSLTIKLGHINLYFGEYNNAYHFYVQAMSMTENNSSRFNQAKAYWELKTGLALSKIKNGDIGGFEDFHESKKQLLIRVSNDLWYDNFFKVD